jgi:hypothetical protein
MTRSNITAMLVIALGLLTGTAPRISYAADEATTAAGAATPTAAGATTPIPQTGGTPPLIPRAVARDFVITVDRPSATAMTGGQVRYKLTFTSVGGFDGEVKLQLPAESLPPKVVADWSSSHFRLPPNGSFTTFLTVHIQITTPPGIYAITTLQALGGSVRHFAPDLALTVTPPPPGTITATFSPDRPIVGVTEVRITGQATAGDGVIDTSTFPDGTKHAFTIDISGAGHYIDGPFVLRQLGTYHDVLVDYATGATIEMSYQGIGDFSTSVDRASATVARGEEAKFEVTFKSLSGFAGAVTPAVPDLSRIAGASASWSSRTVTVRSDGSTAIGLKIKTLSETPPGTYKVNVQGTNGSVTHTAPSEIELTVTE